MDEDGSNHKVSVFHQNKKSVQIQYKISLFSRLIMNIMHCFLLCFPNYIKCFAGSYIYFPCCTSSYINCVLPYHIYACSDTTKSTGNGGCTCVTAICEEVISLASDKT